jgi:hypothetical protein
MFEAFPGEYVWNLSIGSTLATGGLIGDADRACRPLLGAPADQSETEAFRSWSGPTDTLVGLTDEHERSGHRHSAGEKQRAAVYYQTADRMQSSAVHGRRSTYAKVLETFARFVEFTDQAAERVEISYGAGSFPGILVPAEGPGPAPCVIFFNGLDSTKERFYGTGTAQELGRRDIATLIVDPPESGEALRPCGIPAIPDTEKWAADWITETVTELRTTALPATTEHSARS